MGLVLFFLLTYVPLTRGMDYGPMYTRDPEGQWSVRNLDLRHWRGLRWNQSAAFGSQGSVSWSAPLDRGLPTPYPTRRIWVVCQTPGQPAHALGEALVEELLTQDSMAEVAFFPFVQLPITEFRPPDLWITLNQIERASTTLPGYFSAKGTVALTITPRLQDTLDRTKQEITAPFFTSLLHYDGARVGLISAAGRWMRLGEELAGIAQVDSYLESLQGATQERSAVLGIELLHGPIVCERPQALADLGTEVKQLKEGPAWMVHDLSAWALKPGSDRESRLAKLREALIAEGWSLVSATPESFRLKLGERQLSAGPQFHPDWYGNASGIDKSTFEDSRIGIQHFHPFTTEESLLYLNQRLEQGLTKPQLLALLAQLSPARRRSLVDSFFNKPVDKTGSSQKLRLPFHFEIIAPLLDSKQKQQ